MVDSIFILLYSIFGEVVVFRDAWLYSCSYAEGGVYWTMFSDSDIVRLVNRNENEGPSTSAEQMAHKMQNKELSALETALT